MVPSVGWMHVLLWTQERVQSLGSGAFAPLSTGTSSDSSSPSHAPPTTAATTPSAAMPVTHLIGPAYRQERGGSQHDQRNTHRRCQKAANSAPGTDRAATRLSQPVLPSGNAACRRPGGSVARRRAALQVLWWNRLHGLRNASRIGRMPAVRVVPHLVTRRPGFEASSRRRNSRCGLAPVPMWTHR